MQHRPRGHRRSLAIALALPVLAGWSLLSFGPERALAQSPGIHIAGATNVAPLILTRGCNQIVAESANGTPVAGITALVSPMKAVVSIWRFNNGSKLYQVGYFADQTAPTDFSSTGTGTTGRVTESYYVCVTQAATIVSS